MKKKIPLILYIILALLIACATNILMSNEEDLKNGET